MTDNNVNSPWRPLSPHEAAELFCTWDRFWCIAGGWALDLFIGRTTRDHADIDVLVLRQDADALHSQLPGWELWAADPPGHLRLWPKGESLPQPVHDIWCRKAREDEWRFQFMVMDHDETHWIFRRDWSVGGSLASLASEVDGVPVIAPEIQLLYKGNRSRRPKDETDFQTALPHLTPAQRTWLRRALATREPEHPWIPRLTACE